MLKRINNDVTGGIPARVTRRRPTEAPARRSEAVEHQRGPVHVVEATPSPRRPKAPVKTKAPALTVEALLSALTPPVPKTEHLMPIVTGGSPRRGWRTEAMESEGNSLSAAVSALLAKILANGDLDLKAKRRAVLKAMKLLDDSKKGDAGAGNVNAVLGKVEDERGEKAFAPSTKRTSTK